MSTIAFDGTTLAADSQCTMFKGSITKIHRLKDGRLYGASGDVRDAVAVLFWLNNNEKGERPKVSESFHAIIVNDKGFAVLEDNLYPIEYENKFFAVGSGREYAIAAMRLGRTAKEAVELAKLLDVNTGGDVEILQRKGK